MCASDSNSDSIVGLRIEGDVEAEAAGIAIDLRSKERHRLRKYEWVTYRETYREACLEVAYRLIEQDEDLLREWFARPDMGALIAELAHAPPPPDWQERVNAECDKIDAPNFDLHAASSLDTIDQSEPTPAPEAQLHDVHSDDETTHVGAAPVDDRFDNGGDL